jgi:hypothetical protein
MRQSSVGKRVSMVAEDIVRIHPEAATGEDTAF